MLEKMINGQTNNLFIQLFRYTFVGGAAFLIDFGVLYLLKDRFHYHYLFAASISFLLGLVANYFLSILWVFHKRTNQNAWVEFAAFALIGLVGLGFNALIMWLFTELIHFHYLLSKIVSTMIVYFWNFFARKYLLYKGA